MSDFSAKRFLLPALLVLSAANAFAATPSSRYQSRLAYDPIAHRAIMFGGATGIDSGTKLIYYLNETWQWNGSRWTQLFPIHAPSGRSGHVMVYDPIRRHMVLFGGHTATGDLNDTWIFNGLDWVQVNTPNAPPTRFLAAATYDSARDRVIVFGGIHTSDDGKSQTTIYDTWEFDGTTWRQIGGDGPQVAKPVIVYDEERNKTWMIGIDDKGATLMYAYDAGAGTWQKLTPTTLPACANEGVLVYNSAKGVPVYTNGICSGTSVDNETLEWDGTNWTKIEVKNNAFRVFSPASAYDVDRDTIITFGGATSSFSPLNTTYTLSATEGWVAAPDAVTPGGRSLYAFVSDSARNTIWLYGGVTELGGIDDFWQFQNGAWQLMPDTDASPSGCLTPNGVFDTDRQLLVLLCADSSTFEWDGSVWKGFPDLRTKPPFRRFSNMAYDQTLKKTVLFGGFDANSAYLNETWTWNGTEWVRVRNNPAPSRQLAAMWFDPTLKKTVMYGGIGRITSGDRLTRYNDMWSFDGNGWTEIKPSGGTPAARYGAQIGVDPRTNRVILFGGLRVDTIPATPPATIPVQVQVYADDMWQWDGSQWTRITPDGLPPARENAGLTYDPALGVMVMYGGYAGHFLSDMWTLNGNTWRVRADAPAGGRRRAVGRP